MIDTDKALRLQAWLDGELEPEAAREMGAWVSQDEEARAMAEELRAVHQLLRTHEPLHPVPESRDFYWSGIQRAIASSPAEERVSVAEVWADWWRRWRRGFTLATAVAVVALVVARLALPAERDLYLATGHEIDTSEASEGSSISFRSESARMTVVWVEFQIH